MGRDALNKLTPEKFREAEHQLQAWREAEIEKSQRKAELKEGKHEPVKHS